MWGRTCRDGTCLSKHVLFLARVWITHWHVSGLHTWKTSSSNKFGGSPSEGIFPLCPDRSGEWKGAKTNCRKTPVLYGERTSVIAMSVEAATRISLYL